MREDDLIDVSGFSFETPEPKPRDYRFPPAEAWLHAERSYSDGEPAELICRAYGLSLSTFRTRARREGWRRKDVAEAQTCDPISLEPPPAPPTHQMADLAWRSAAEAIRRGKVYEARAWMKLAGELKTLARHEATEARVAADRAAKAEALLEADTSAPELHLLHPDRLVHDEASVAATPHPPKSSLCSLGPLRLDRQAIVDPSAPPTASNPLPQGERSFEAHPSHLSPCGRGRDPRAAWEGEGSRDDRRT